MKEYTFKYWYLEWDVIGNSRRPTYQEVIEQGKYKTSKVFGYNKNYAKKVLGNNLMHMTEKNWIGTDGMYGYIVLEADE